MTFKNGFGKISVRYLFYQPMDEKIKTWTLRFPAKENPNMEKASFDWPMVLQHDVKAKYRLISRKFSRMRSFSRERSLNQSKATSVCICSTNQSYCSISVLLLFLFCSRVFISRAYENRSIFMNLTHKVWFVLCTCVAEKVEGNEYKLIIFKNTVCFNSLNSNSFLEIFFP